MIGAVQQSLGPFPEDATLLRSDGWPAPAFPRRVHLFDRVLTRYIDLGEARCPWRSPSSTASSSASSTQSALVCAEYSSDRVRLRVFVNQSPEKVITS